MKRMGLALSISLAFVSLLSLCSANPVVSDLTVLPSTHVWLGENINVSCKCYETNETHNITNVSAEIVGPINFSNLILDRTDDDTYSWTTNNPEFFGNHTGEYNIIVYCRNDNNTQNSTSVNFTISRLTSEIKTVSPSPAYIGDTIEMDVVVKEDDEFKCLGVDFDVKLNDNPVDLIQPPGCSNNVWTLKIDAPLDTGVYDVEVIARYDRANATATSSIEIKQPLQLELIDIDKTWVKPGDNITITFKGLYKGELIDFKKEYLNFWINSTDCSIVDISQTGDYSYVKISTPNLSPGSYDFKIRFSYMGFVKEFSEEIDYIVPVSGDVIGSDNKPLFAQLKFKGDKTERTFTTDGNGHYSGNLPPGIYDLELTFSNSKLYLSNVMIEEFNDPIRYDYTTTGVDIPGIGVGEIFVYEVALTYSGAKLEMKYDDSKIVDEERITVYRCENWNFGRKVCNGEWEEIEGEIDTIRNLVKLNVTSLSAFVIGYKKKMYVDFNTEKEEYYLKDVIKVLGVTEDEDEKPVSKAQIEVKILDTSISASTKSDDSGVFSLEFQGPDKEGNYTLLVTAKKPPYPDANKTLVLRIIRSRKLSLMMPDSMKVQQGGNASLEVSILNTGQTDFSNLSLSLTGIPEHYYTLSKSEIEELKAGEEEKVSIYFIIPEDATVDSYSGTFKVVYDDSSLEERFVLSILVGEKNETEVSTPEFKLPSLSLPTGKILLPSFTGVLWVLLAGVSTFSVSVWLKRRKRKVVERKDIKNLLLDIKREINRKPVRKKRVHHKKRKG